MATNLQVPAQMWSVPAQMWKVPEGWELLVRPHLLLGGPQSGQSRYCIAFWKALKLTLPTVLSPYSKDGTTKDLRGSGQDSVS